MPMQYSVSLRNNQADQIDVLVGVAVLCIYSGSKPNTCMDDGAGELLCEIPLPTEWLSKAQNGIKSKNGEWKGVSVSSGKAGYFRIKSGEICHIQGTISEKGGNGDMIIVNPTIVKEQDIIVDSFSVIRGNA